VARNIGSAGARAGLGDRTRAGFVAVFAQFGLAWMVLRASIVGGNDLLPDGAPAHHVAHVAVIYATVPFLAAALGWLAMRERPTAGALASSLIALAGVAAMVGFGHEGGFRGDLLAFGMTVTMAVAMVVARHFPPCPFCPRRACRRC